MVGALLLQGSVDHPDSGRRAAQVVSDHLQDGGADPVAVLSKEMPGFRTKSLLRRVANLAPPNALLDLGLATPPMRALASRIYFHRRSSPGAVFDDFRQPEGPQPSAERSVGSPKLECK